MKELNCIESLAQQEQIILDIFLRIIEGWYSIAYTDQQSTTWR